MTRGLAVLAALTSLLQGPQPLFRSGTDLVRVDALVLRDGKPVTGLGADDFEVRDNGVLQQVTAAATADAVHLALTLDASGSMTPERLQLSRAAAEHVVGQLTGHDRFDVFAFNDQVALIGDSRRPASALSETLARVQAGGSTALVDAAYTSIVHGAAGGGPTLLLLMTDGRNNNSFLRAQDAIDAARRHETAIYPVAVEMDRRWDRTVVWPHLRTSDSLALLRLLADETGGQLIEARWDARLPDVFARILAEYRQRYIVTFTPEGVGRNDGWHRIEVKLRRGKGTVRARTRYWAGAL